MIFLTMTLSKVEWVMVCHSRMLLAGIQGKTRTGPPIKTFGGDDFEFFDTSQERRRPVGDPAHPILPVGLSSYPVRGIGDRVASFTVEGDHDGNEDSHVFIDLN